MKHITIVVFIFLFAFFGGWVGAVQIAEVSDSTTKILQIKSVYSNREEGLFVQTWTNFKGESGKPLYATVTLKKWQTGLLEIPLSLKFNWPSFTWERRNIYTEQQGKDE